MTVESHKQNVFDKELYLPLELMAANLYRNIVVKHIFYNGNKRTAANALYISLRLNNSKLSVEPDEFTEFTVRMVVEKLDEAVIAE